jgi:hypothetical protein
VIVHRTAPELTGPWSPPDTRVSTSAHARFAAARETQRSQGSHAAVEREVTRRRRYGQPTGEKSSVPVGGLWVRTAKVDPRV